MEDDGTATAAAQAKEGGGIASRVASSSSIACGGPLEQVGRSIVFLALCFVLFIMGLLKGLRFIFPTFILSSSSWQLPTLPPFFAFFFLLDFLLLLHLCVGLVCCVLPTSCCKELRNHKTEMMLLLLLQLSLSLSLSLSLNSVLGICEAGA
jgi:hypothetical protein